jgi:hypothetical protein
LQKFPFLLAFLTACACAQPAPPAVTTAQYNNARTGANLRETVLTPRNVNSKTFGKIFTLHVDGDVYAQPLYLPHVNIPNKGAADVLFVATEHDSVYAFDAESAGPEPFWRVSFVDDARGVRPLRPQEVQCPFIRPEIGITPTPVIDPATGTLYVLARTREDSRYVQRLHALDVASGAEKFGGPVEISAALPKKNFFSSAVSFDALRENPRAALLLSGGRVWLTWASSCDVGTYYGWVMAYDAQTLKQIAVFNAAPDGEQTGIWHADAGPAADEQGNVFAATGNGEFNAASGGRDYGDTVLKLALNGSNIQVADFFTPSNQKSLNATDEDLGSQGPVLFDDPKGPHPHLLVVSGKGEGVYLIDRDHMGRFAAGDNPHALQVVSGTGGCFGAAAWWNGHVFIHCSNEPLKDYALQSGRLALAAQGTEKFLDPGAIPVVSANGTRDAIVWTVQTRTWRASEPDRPAILHAYDATNVGHELYRSSQDAARDSGGVALRFAMPTVVNGRVYVGAKGEVDVYGLLAPPAPARPTASRGKK